VGERKGGITFLSSWVPDKIAVVLKPLGPPTGESPTGKELEKGAQIRGKIPAMAEKARLQTTMSGT
jgi:hypothetical protein